jgi:uncharacterized protein involved in exopolysaccharide biosynthesis
MLSLPPSAHAEGTQQLDLLPKLLNAIFKWKWLIVATTFAVAVPVALVLFMRTPMYEVKMRILIKAARSQAAVSLLPAGHGVASPAVTPQIVNSEIQVLKSPDLLVPAIAQSRYQLLPPDQPDTPITRERALQTLRARISFNLVPDSNVIDVTLQDPDPRQGAALLNVLAGLYLRKHADLQAGGDNTANFFKKQVQFHKEKFDRARAALEKFQEKDNIVNLGSEMDLNLTRLMQAEATLKDLQGEIDSTSKEIAALEEQAKGQPEEVTKESRVIINPEVAALTTKLVDVQRQRDELLQRYQPGSRFVRDKESEIEAIKASIAAKERTIVGERLIAQNRVKESVVQTLMAKKVALEAAIAKRRTLITEKKAYEERLDVLKDRSFDLGRLRGDFDMARETYFMYEKKAEEARVSRAMDEENIVNAGMIQEAKAPVIALPRNLAIWGPVAAMAGGVLGLALALVLEFFSLTIKDERDVEQFLQVPVLATVRHF